jgi:carotenoid cleavage dioxygenase
METQGFTQTRAGERDVNDLNPFLHGAYAPIKDEVTVLDCKVTGKVPNDLYGAYVRNGPNPLKWPAGMHHWFDGDGMLHGAYFADGKVEYRNRYIGGSDFRAEQAGRCEVGGIFSKANPARAPRVYKDTGNTDVVLHNGSLMTLWYISGLPVRLDARTLETLGEERFGGKLPRNVSAHSKVDPKNGEFVFFDYALYEPWMSYGVVDRNNVLTNFQTVSLPGPRLPHDMGLTENYVVLHDLPVVFSEQGMRNNLWQIRQLDQPARFGVAPRNGKGSDIKWFETEPCYIYHVVNCWEDGDDVVMHACKMIPNNLKPDRAYGAYAEMAVILTLYAVPVEWRMNMKTGAVKFRQLDDRISEFPIVNLDEASRPTRWSYNCSFELNRIHRIDGYYKYDLGSGACESYRLPKGVFGSEPAFAPRVGAKDEDDGYLLFFTTDEANGHSEVEILSAKAFGDGPMARVQIPYRVPVGFHATWANGAQIRAA